MSHIAVICQARSVDIDATGPRRHNRPTKTRSDCRPRHALLVEILRCAQNDGGACYAAFV